MELQHGIFAVKLCELEQEYGRLLSRLRLLQEQAPDQIRREREQMQEEYREHGLMLEETARSCRSPTMAQMAELQQTYERQIIKLLERVCAGGSAETTTLAAEFTIDFATQAMHYALFMALQALELQIQEDTTEGVKAKHE